jgi:hypothetical protein
MLHIDFSLCSTFGSIVAMPVGPDAEQPNGLIRACHTNGISYTTSEIAGAKETYCMGKYNDRVECVDPVLLRDSQCVTLSYLWKELCLHAQSCVLASVVFRTLDGCHWLSKEHVFHDHQSYFRISMVYYPFIQVIGGAVNTNDLGLGCQWDGTCGPL